jgi:hypothetical protein
MHLTDCEALRSYMRQCTLRELADIMCCGAGCREVSDKVWLVSFMQYDLGFPPEAHPGAAGHTLF